MTGAMKAPATIRADPDRTQEERSFTHAGLTYVVRAERTKAAWKVAAYLEGRKASREFELPCEADDPTPAGVADLLDELMIQAEQDVRVAAA
jgi:hypothetical protein